MGEISDAAEAAWKLNLLWRQVRYLPHLEPAPACRPAWWRLCLEASGTERAGEANGFSPSATVLELQSKLASLLHERPCPARLWCPIDAPAAVMGRLPGSFRGALPPTGPSLGCTGEATLCFCSTPASARLLPASDDLCSSGNTLDACAVLSAILVSAAACAGGPCSCWDDSGRYSNDDSGTSAVPSSPIRVPEHGRKVSLSHQFMSMCPSARPVLVSISPPSLFASASYIEGVAHHST
jgi:hypothetical protein